MKLDVKDNGAICVGDLVRYLNVDDEFELEERFCLIVNVPYANDGYHYAVLSTNTFDILEQYQDLDELRSNCKLVAKADTLRITNL